MMREICEQSHCIIGCHQASLFFFSSVACGKFRRENKTVQDSLDERNGVAEEWDRIVKEGGKSIENVVMFKFLGANNVKFPGGL
jgi:hypothetical protein